MKQERIKILEMLDAGKITADDAAKLLETLKPKHHHHHHDWDWDNDFDANDLDEKMKKFSDYVRDMGDKMNSAFKDVEPKFKHATRKVVEKTADLVGEISKSLNETLQNMDEGGCGCEPNSEEACCCESTAEESCGCAEPDDQPREN